MPWMASPPEQPRYKGLPLRWRFGLFIGNWRHDAPVSDASLQQRALQKGGELTYTYTPPGLGGARRHDEDGVLDGDEEDSGDTTAYRSMSAGSAG